MASSISKAPFNGGFPWLSRWYLLSIASASRLSYLIHRAGYCDMVPLQTKGPQSSQDCAIGLSIIRPYKERRTTSWTQSRLRVVKKALGLTSSMTQELQRIKDFTSHLAFNSCSRCQVIGGIGKEKHLLLTVARNQYCDLLFTDIVPRKPWYEPAYGVIDGSPSAGMVPWCFVCYGKGSLRVDIWLSNVFQWWTIDRVGRRKLFISNALGMCFVLVAEAICVSINNTKAAVAAVVFVFAFEACFTWGML